MRRNARDGRTGASPLPDAKIVEGRPPSTEDEIIEFVKGHEIVVAGIERYTKRVLDNLPDLQVIACCSAGVDHLDPVLLNERGIRMGWIPGVNKYAVSEMAVCFMIDILRDIHTSNVRLARREVVTSKRPTSSRSNRRRTWLRQLGKEVVKLLQPFGCEILACDREDYPTSTPSMASRLSVPRNCGPGSEVLTVHLPRNSTTIGLYSAEVLDKLRPGIFVVNTARGQIFDEAALAERLGDGRIAAAAFDVFAIEPPERTELVELPNFLGTAHIGAGAEEAWVAMAEAGIRGITENAVPEPGVYPFD